MSLFAISHFFLRSSTATLNLTSSIRPRETSFNRVLLNPKPYALTPKRPRLSSSNASSRSSSSEPAARSWIFRLGRVLGDGCRVLGSWFRKFRFGGCRVKDLGLRD